jgi:hypothetical protein
LDPTELALEEAHTEMDRWFRSLLPQEAESSQAISIVGRVALYTIDATQRWPEAFLAEPDELSDDFRRAMRQISIQSGPDLSVSSMVPRPLDTGPVAELLEETWERLGARSVILCLGVAGLVGTSVYLYFLR